LTFGARTFILWFVRQGNKEADPRDRPKASEAGKVQGTGEREASQSVCMRERSARRSDR